MPRDIAILAQNQLKAWEDLAETWPVKQEVKEDGTTQSVCLECHQAIWTITDRWGKPYRYKEGDTRSLIVGHLRQNHLEWESIVYRLWEAKNAGTIS